MSEKRPMPGPGQFQWNTGGWFGSQLGCTARLVVGAVVPCVTYRILRYGAKAGANNFASINNYPGSPPTVWNAVSNPFDFTIHA